MRIIDLAGLTMFYIKVILNTKMKNLLIVEIMYSIVLIDKKHGYDVAKA